MGVISLKEYLVGNYHFIRKKQTVVFWPVAMLPLTVIIVTKYDAQDTLRDMTKYKYKCSLTLTFLINL